MNAEAWQRAWRRQRVILSVYAPNALAANVLLERVTALPVVPLICFCVAADAAIYGLMSLAFRGWSR